MFNHLFNTIKKIEILPILHRSENGRNYRFHVARFDELDPVISGNKFFKLKYNIERALLNKKAGIITMGGAFSNHLVATANICKRYGLKSIGLIRGEIPATLNHTLAYCQSENMEFIPVPRHQFSENADTIHKIIKEHPDFHFVPMGGANDDGIRGAAEMTDMIADYASYDVIICAIGSGTMFKGFQKKILPHQQLIGIPVMKIQEEDKNEFIKSYTINNNIKIYTAFAGKGYGKADTNILALMNEIYTQHQLPLDFVYTGKLMNALLRLIDENKIDAKKKILFIHSGGLQGNRSLPASALIF